MKLSYKKKNFFLLVATFMTSTVSIKASEEKFEGKTEIKKNELNVKDINIIKDININEEIFPETVDNLTENSDNSEINDLTEKYTKETLELYNTVKDKTYKPKNSFKDIFAGYINLKNSNNLNASGFKEEHPLKATLLGFSKVNGLTYSSDVVKSIQELSNNEATAWWNALCYVNSIDSAFFESYFNLIELDLSDNQFKEIDLKLNKKLQILSLNYNKIDEINLENNPDLKILYISNNTLKKISSDVCINLIELDLSYNRLQFIDLKKKTKLGTIVLNNNEFTEIDLENNPDLKKFWIGNNKLKKLNVTKNINLDYLSTPYNGIEEIDLTQNLDLNELYISNNLITKIDLTQNILLKRIFLTDNKISKIDLRSNKALKYVDLKKNPIEKKDILENFKKNVLSIDKQKSCIIF